MEILQNIKNKLSHDPAIPLMGINPKESNQDLKEIFALPSPLRHYSHDIQDVVTT